MKLTWTILYVEDVPKTVDFYEACFGIKRKSVHESGMFAEMDTGDVTLAFTHVDLIADIPNARPAPARADVTGMEIAFTSDDVPTAYAHAVAHGAQSVVAPTVKPWGQTVSYVRDLNGFLVEIGSPVG